MIRKSNKKRKLGLYLIKQGLTGNSFKESMRVILTWSDKWGKNILMKMASSFELVNPQIYSFPPQASSLVVIKTISLSSITVKSSLLKKNIAN